jgi:uncharacterized membrane protein
VLSLHEQASSRRRCGVDGRKEPDDSTIKNTALGVTLGSGVGLTVGLVCWGAQAIPLGLALGAGVGVAIGAVLDERSRRGRP